VGAGRAPTAGEEVLSPRQRLFEGLALALRTSGGVPSSVVPHDPDLDGLVERRHGRAVLTVRGRLLANDVTLRMVVPDGSDTPGTGPVAVPGPSGAAGILRP
jgi:hypothetical protein